MSQPNDSKKSATPLDQDNTMIAVIEMGQASWLVAGIVPGLERQPLKKLGSDERALIQLLLAPPNGYTHCRISTGL